MQRFIDEGTDLAFNWTLSVAAERGDAGLTKLLLDRGASLKGEDGASALIAAVENDNLDFLQFLLGLGAEVNASTEGDTALLVAIQRDKAEAARLLILAGARVNLRTIRKHNNRRLEDQATPLIEAAMQKRAEILRLMLELAPPEQVAEQHADLVQNAAYFGTLAICKLLVERGISFRVEPGLKSPLETAADYGRAEICELIIASGAEARMLEEGLFGAVRGYKPEIVQMLLKAGADPNGDFTLHHDGYSPLGYAIGTLNGGSRSLYEDVAPRAVKVVRLLLAAGADPDRERRGETPLACAKRHDFHALVEVLEQAGARAVGIESFAVLFYRHSPPTAVESEAMLTHVHAQSGSRPRLLLTSAVAGRWPTTPDEFVVATVLLACQEAGVPTDSVHFAGVHFVGGPELAVAWRSRRTTG